MKAIVCEKYGLPEVLQLREVEKPVPKNNEVLIKVLAASVTTSDCNIRDAVFVPPGFRLIQRLAFGLRKPKIPIPGVELSGTIEAIGKDVKLFKEGDQVFGSTALCHLGAYAEYKCFPEDGALAIKPINLTYEEAAVIPIGAATALFFLRDLAHIQKKQRVLIIGASGGVGTYAVQLAKYYDAEVTGVCSTTNLEFVKSQGADKVIDYSAEDFTKGCETYDIILDVIGKSSFSKCRKLLKQKGVYAAVAGGPKEFLQMLLTKFTGKKVLAGMAPDRKEDLIFLKGIAEIKKIRPIIDRSYPLEQIADAHRYVDKGHKKGNVVITVKHNGS